MRDFEYSPLKKKTFPGFSIRAGSWQDSPTIPHELTAHLTEKLPNILWLTWAWNIQEKQKNPPYIPSNFSGDLCFKSPKFKIFQGSIPPDSA